MIADEGHVHGGGAGGVPVSWLLLVPFILAALLYLAGALRGSRRGRVWPWYRHIFWAAGLLAGAMGFVGPLAEAAHGSFTAHMAAHLMVGMVAPLLLALAAPVTLTLRAVSVVPARRLSRLLRSPAARVLTHPVVAALLNVGGMWVLYLTPLYARMQQDMLVHVLVMAHFLIAGYLYTVSLVAVDPAPHRAGILARGLVLMISLAAHGILAKAVYAYPPAGVSTSDAHAGAQLMFYGGDVVEFILIVLLAAEWYRVTGRRLQPLPGRSISVRPQ